MRPLDRKILALAVPALGALVVEPLYNLTDSAIVGHLGPAPLGGLAVATGALNVVGWVAAFLEMATVSAISYRRSAGDDRGAGRMAGAAYLLSIGVGLVVAAAVEAAAPLLVSVLGGHTSPAVAHDAVEYLHIAALGMPVLLMALAGNGHLTGLADTRRPFAIALGSNAVNIVLEVVLVYGLHLGIAGSAWGTVAAQAVSAVVFVAVSFRAAVPPRSPGRREIGLLLHDAVPLTIRTVALGIALLSATAIAARLGTRVLGGQQIAMQLWLTLALALDALAVPAQVYVSEELGRGANDAAREVGRRTLVMGLVLGVLLAVAVVGLSPVLPAVFSPDAAVQHQATLALVVCGLQQPLAAIAFVLDGLVLGTSDYGSLRRVMLLALVAYAPLAVLTLEYHSIGILGIWFAITCWLAARCVFLGRRWHSMVRALSPAS